jgi:hypothetical protein
MSARNLPLRALLVGLAGPALLAACRSSPPEAEPRVAVHDDAAIFPALLSTGFESGLGAWTAQTTSGTCTWHVRANPELLRVAANIYPGAVLLADGGYHLPARSGSNVAWFGEDTTGTYIGTPYTAPAFSGGISTAVQTGTLTSPGVALPGSSRAALEFDAWYEVEAQAGQTKDVMAVEVSANGGAFAEVGRINPTFPTGAPSQTGFVTGGPSVPPGWRHYVFDLSSFAGQSVVVRFRFDSVDLGYNAYRGWSLDNVQIGAGASFPAPTLTSVTPATSIANGIVTVSGSNFLQGATLRLNAVTIPADKIVQFGASQLIFQVPFGLADGSYSVQVVNPDSQSATLPNAYTATSAAAPHADFVTPSTTTAGVATAVTITGTGFVSGATVTVGGLAATGVAVVSPTSLTATFPPLPVGVHNVTVTSPGGLGFTTIGLFNVPPVVDASTLAVTAPNGGESWIIGTSHPVTWTQTGVTTVAIDLYDGGTFARNIATGVAAAGGSYSWALPSDLPPSTEYKVKVRNQLGTSFDYSDAAFEARVPATVDLQSGGGQSAAAGSAFASPVCFRVHDAANNPLPGRPVAFTVPATGATATLGSASAVSDASGVACVTATAGTVAGAYLLTAQTDSSTATAGLTNNAAAPAALVRVSGDAQSAAVNTAFATALAVRVDDAYGNHVPGATVTYAAPATGARAVLSSTTASTNAAGVASVTATAGTVAGAYSVTATVSGVATPVSFALTNTAGAPASISTVAGSTPQSAVVGGAAFANPLAVTVLDGFSNPVPSVTVNFAAPATGARATLSAASAVTGATGRAQVTASTGTVAGSYSVTASIAGLSASFALTNTAGAPASISTVAGSTPQSAAVGGAAFANPLAVTVLDSFSNPVPSATVNFAAPATGARAVLSAASAVTGATGGAQVTATTGTVAGSYSVSASISGGPSTGFALTNTAGAPASITTVAGSTPQSAVVGGAAFGSPLAVVVRDSFANGVPGVTVNFAAPATGARATLSAASAVTGATGGAQVTATTGTVAGSYNVTASIAGGFSVSFALTNTAGAPSSITAAAGSTPQSAVVGGNAFANPLAVTVRDSFSNPVPSVTVNFAAPATGARAALSAPSAVTGPTGDAQVTASTGNVAGSYSVTASIAGGPSTGFALTNTAGDAAALVRVSGNGQSATVATSFATALSARVEDAFGNPVQGVLVSFAVPGSGATAVLSSTSANTGASGIASVTATAGTVAGAYQVTATAATVGTPVTFGLTNTAGAPASIAAAAGSTPQSAEAGGFPFANPLAVTVRDTHGNGVPGVTVNFATPATGARAVLSAPSAVTGPTGGAQITATTGNVAGSYTVTATIAGGLSTGFALTNAIGAPAVLALVSGDAQSTPVTSAFATALVARVEDVHGNPVAGVLVGFAAPATGARAVLSSTGLATDASGLASVTATAGTVAGAYQVTATATGVAIPLAFHLENLPGAPASVTAAAGAATQSASVGTAFGQALSVTVRDTHGNAVPGVTVSWTPPASGPTAALSATTAVTGPTGAASVDATAGVVTGAYTVQASVAGVATPASFALTNTAGPPGTVAQVSGSPQQAVVDAPYAAPLVVEVRDVQLNPVPGAMVVFSAPLTGASAVLSAASAVTGTDGRASVTATAGTVAGAFQVTATVTGAAAPASFALTNLPGPAASVVAASSSSGQSSQVGQPFASALAVTVTDQHGNAVAGVTVDFACPAGGPTCTVSPASAVTGADGKAQADATAGTTPGSYDATATVSGLAAATFALTNLVGPPGSIAVVAGGAQRATVLDDFGSPLLVVVRDDLQNPVPSVTVTYEVVSGGAQAAVLSSDTAVTDASGQASVTATANGAQGSYEVRATAAGVATPATFALENTAVVTAMTAKVELLVFSAVVGGEGSARLSVAVGPTQAGAHPGGTITVTGTRPLSPAPGQPGLSQSGASVIGTLVSGAIEMNLLVDGWRSETLTIAYTPDAGSSQIWTAVSVTRELRAEGGEQGSGGGCSTGGGGGLVLLPLLLLLLRGRSRRALLVTAAAAALLAPRPASAQLVAGARLGWAFPAGNIAQGGSLSRELSSQIPIQLEAGWRLLPPLTVGGYLGFGIGRVGDVCTGSATCSGRTFDLGVQATWRFALRKAMPWAGAGLGYAWARNRLEEGGDVREVKFRGPEFLRLMGGVDWPVGRTFTVGPFAQWGLGRYGHTEISSPLGGFSGKTPDPAMHSWLSVGVRGTFEATFGQNRAR